MDSSDLPDSDGGLRNEARVPASSSSPWAFISAAASYQSLRNSRTVSAISVLRSRSGSKAWAIVRQANTAAAPLRSRRAIYDPGSMAIDFERLRLLWPDHLGLARGKYLTPETAESGTAHCISLFTPWKPIPTWWRLSARLTSMGTSL
jgi:hypothetical protein